MIFRVSECFFKTQQIYNSVGLPTEERYRYPIQRQVQTTITSMVPNSKTASKCLNMFQYVISIFQYTVVLYPS